MYQIRPWLFVGKYRETLDADWLYRQQITAMLHLAEDVQHAGIITLYLEVDDGVPIPVTALEAGTEFIRRHKAAQRRVLVACGAGISRSVSFAIAALKEDEGLSLVEAYHELWQVHPEAMPHPKLWQSLQAYYHENTSFMDMLDLQREWKAT